MSYYYYHDQYYYLPDPYDYYSFATDTAPTPEQPNIIADIISAIMNIIAGIFGSPGPGAAGAPTATRPGALAIPSAIGATGKLTPAAQLDENRSP